ncbi:hypothetical protein [Streptomyces sp. NPDC101166]|uniref:hypothetical protein n=1 Tax=Streptomyces sp. NPDC101166 TaxID=3366120 RepID=UPI0038108A0F
MATDDYGQGISVADLSQQPNAETLAKNIANGLAARSVLRYASGSARTAALTGATAPAEGMVTWLQDVNRLYVYDGSTWVELGRALNTEFVDDPTSRTVTSTSFVNSSFTLSDTIVGPQSGQVEVTFGVRCDNSSGSNTLSSFDATGSSTGTIYTANNEAATQWGDTSSAGPFVVTQVIPCAAGETVTVTLKHRVVSGTGNLRYRYLRLRQL